MTSLTPSRVIICALIASALLSLTPDQLHKPIHNRNANFSFNPFIRNNQNIDRAARTRIEQGYGQLPMRFEANNGQTDARVKFMARGAGYAVFLTENETVLQLRKGKSKDDKLMADQPDESAVLRMKLVGSNPSSPISGVRKLQATSNYFIGNDPAAWRRGVSNYSKVKYESVYPGIDLLWYGNQQLLEHDFLVGAGADPGRIKLSFTGTDKISIDEEGALVLRAGGEDLRLLKPIAWQESNGARRSVDCDYRRSGGDQVEFRLGDYDTTLPLVIDPVLVYSTYIGGLGTDFGMDIAVDDEGAAYIAGQTNSADFPGPSPIQPVRGTLMDAFVLKINPAGNAIVFGTWIGGNSTDSASSIAVDQSGNIFLVGNTNSTDFPLQNPLQVSLKGFNDAFALKIDPSGSALLYSTYIGGIGIDGAASLAIDAEGNLYLTGSTEGDFPIVNAFQPVNGGSGAYASDNAGESWGKIGNGLRGADVNDLFLAPGDSSMLFAGTDRGVFKSVDRGLSWNLLGGDQFIRNINQVIVDPSSPDILYAVSAPDLYKSIDGGATWALKPISPTTFIRTLAIDQTTPSRLYAGTFNGLWISTDAGGSWTLAPITRFDGGISIGQVESIVVDPITPSTIYIGAQGIYKSVDAGATWAFAGNSVPISRIAISRSNPATLYAVGTNATIYKTINAGGNWVQLNTPAIGIFSSSPWPLVVSPGNPNVVYVGSRNSGIFRSNNGGASWNSINNGLVATDIRALAIDTNSPERVYAGSDSGTEAFVAKLDPTGSSFVYSSYLGGGATDFGASIAVDSTGAAYIAGSTTSSDFPVVNAFQPIFAGQVDAFVARVNESGTAISWATFLGGINLDNASGIALSPTGKVYVTGVTSSNNFPLMNAIQPTFKGVQDLFVTKLKNDGSGLDFSTYLGGLGFEIGSAIAVDFAGNPYVTGVTNSPDFPVINAVQPARGGNPAITNNDAFVTKLVADGSSLVYSTYLGGSSFDQGNSIAVDTAANAYVTGNAQSNDFPTTSSPIRTAGPSDAFVTKIGASADLAIGFTVDRDPGMVNNQFTFSVIVTNSGPDPAINSRVMNTLPDGLSLISSATSQGSCSGTRVVNCELGNLAVGGSALITINAIPSTAGTITNSANVTSGTFDPSPANNSATLQSNISLLPSIYGGVTMRGGTGLSGVNVALSGAARPPLITTALGNYQFAELPAGSNYTVTPSRQGYVFNPPNRTINNLQSDQRADFQGVVCSISISSNSQSFPAIGGTGSVAITGSDPQCVWTAVSNVPWIKFISATTGNGNGVLSFKVDPTVGSRTGTLTIGGNKLTVIQQFNPCSTLSFKTTNLVSLGGTLFVSGTSSKIIAEDFNNDSVSDLVINRTPSAASLTLSLSNSTGGFDDARLLFNNAVSTFRTGDLNKDGKLDLALIPRDQPARVLILIGDGMGGFSAPVSIETGPLPRHLAIADFNNDNLPDLAVVTDPLTPDPNRSNYNLAIHPGDGMGSFASPTHIGFTTRPRSIPVAMEAGDFNADGKPDLAVAGILGPVIIFTNDSAAGFTITRIEDIQTTSEEGWMEVGDFNGDRKTDLALRHSEAGKRLISIWISTSSGMFQRAFSIDAQNFGNKFLAADLNGDGKSDLGVTLDNSFVVRYAKSDGTFSEPVSYLIGFRVIQPTLGDFKQDGRNLRTDVFVPTVLFNDLPPGPPAAILRSNGLGDFDAPRSFEFLSGGSIDRAEMESADLNGDGVLDLAIADILLNDVVMMFGNGRGEFTPPVKINSGVTNGRATDIELRDFNNDGKTDLAILNFETKNVVVLLGNGRGEFTQSAIFNTGPSPRNIGSADFNNDGNFDLIATAQSGGLALYLGNGQGGFTQSVTGIGGNSTNIIFNTGDFNGDGTADLAYSDNNQNPFPNGVKIVILFGNGQDGFGNSANVITQNVFDSIRSINKSDLNLDGRDDLIYTLDLDFNSDPVLIALSNPGGSFATPVRFQSDINTFNVKPKDINGDGIPDLLIPRSNKIFALLGKGDGSFEQPVSLLDFEFPGLIIAEDFDEDGTTDLAIARSNVGIVPNRSFCVPQGNVVPISTASKFRYRVARNSIVTLQGENLATTTLAAIPLLLPTTLANTRVRITDSAGVERFAQLSFVSPDRVTLLIPPQTSPGVALITVLNGGNVVAQGTASIATTAPGLFSADLSGEGYASGLVLRIRANGSRTYEPVALFDFEQNRFVAVPIDVSNVAEQVFLLLSGTGIRNHSGLANVRAKVGPENAEVTFAGSQGILPGVDQVDLRLLPTLQERGEVFVELSVDGRATNPVRVKIK